MTLPHVRNTVISWYYIYIFIFIYSFFSSFPHALRHDRRWGIHVTGSATIRSKKTCATHERVDIFMPTFSIFFIIITNIITITRILRTAHTMTWCGIFIFIIYIDISHYILILQKHHAIFSVLRFHLMLSQHAFEVLLFLAMCHFSIYDMFSFSLFSALISATAFSSLLMLLHILWHFSLLFYCIFNESYKTLLSSYDAHYHTLRLMKESLIVIAIVTFILWAHTPCRCFTRHVWYSKTEDAYAGFSSHALIEHITFIDINNT